MRKTFLLLLLIALSCGMYAQKHKEHKKAPLADKTIPDTITKFGIASFYAKKFDGRQTASGEIFNSKKYTAACNILPLNTWVQITNVRNERTVIVKINDRMHPKNKRLIDLSRIAANDLGFAGRGLTRVKLVVLKNYHPDIVAD